MTISSGTEFIVGNRFEDFPHCFRAKFPCEDQRAVVAVLRCFARYAEWRQVSVAMTVDEIHQHVWVEIRGEGDNIWAAFTEFLNIYLHIRHPWMRSTLLSFADQILTPLFLQDLIHWVRRKLRFA